MALLPGKVVLAALALLTGVALGPLAPAMAAVVQARAAPELRGRVVSTRWSLALVASPLGVLGTGLVLEWAGPAAALLVAAAGLLATAVFAAASPSLRRIEPHQLTLERSRHDPRNPVRAVGGPRPAGCAGRVAARVGAGR